MSHKPITFSEKMVFFIGGMLLGAFVMLLLLKLSGSYWGGIIGIVINIAGAWYILKKSKQLTVRKKILAYGIIGSIITTVVLAVGLWVSLSAAFQGIAN